MNAITTFVLLFMIVAFASMVTAEERPYRSKCLLGIWGSATKVETEDGKIQYVDGFEGEPTWAEYTCPDYNGVCWTVGCKNQSAFWYEGSCADKFESFCEKQQEHCNEHDMDPLCVDCQQDYCNDYKKYIDPSELEDLEREEEGKASNTTDPDINEKAKALHEGEEGTTTDADGPTDEPDNKQQNGAIVMRGSVMAIIVAIICCSAMNYHGPMDGGFGAFVFGCAMQHGPAA